MQERDRGYTPAWSIVCLSQIWVEADIQLCKIVLHAPGPGCSKAFFLLFSSSHGFLIVARKLSDKRPLVKVLVTWRNKYNWFKWMMSSDKKTIFAWNHICWCKLQFFLNSVPFLQQCSKVLTEKNAFPTATNIPDFFFNFYCQILFLHNLSFKISFDKHHWLMQYQINKWTLWKFLQGCKYLAYF